MKTTDTHMSVFNLLRVALFFIDPPWSGSASQTVSIAPVNARPIVAKWFGLQQFLWYRFAVNGDQRVVTASTVEMNGSGQEFL